jgi:hypothetical protein
MLATVLSLALSVGSPQADLWEVVWRALQASKPTPTAPAEAAKVGAPVAYREGYLFRFKAPAETKRVFLAGSFNAWAKNRGGRVSDQKFLMHEGGNGIWWVVANPSPQLHSFKYVVETQRGEFNWFPDPHVRGLDEDGNSVFEFSRVSVGAGQLVGPKGLSSPQGILGPRPSEALEPDRVWYKPNQTISVRWRPLRKAGPDCVLRITTPTGEEVFRTEITGTAQSVTLPGFEREGGYLAQVVDGSKIRAECVLTVAHSIADDLRYGYYTEYPTPAGSYATRASLLARAGLNAVEYYDYFRAHGEYAPTQAKYRTDPFGISIDARDIQHKIEANRSRGILNIAYVAAYAASKSVKDQVPSLMTDERGVPKVFNGRIMPEDEAEREGKDKWFWLTDISRGSLWHNHILQEFRKAADDAPTDFVGFDGFEIDSYGDSADSKFFAKGSTRSGDLLQDVLRDFVSDVRDVTRSVRPDGLVSFNSVNEFAADQMLPVTDFSFLEIWRGHCDSLEGLVDIALANRGPDRKRVVLKLYPADMEPSRQAWSPLGLRRLMGACLVGGASLMVAGEPDAQSRRLRSLRTLYYPEHVLIPPALEEILKSYNSHDALLYGLSHGRGVFSVDVPSTARGCITQAFAAPEHQLVAIQILRQGSEPRWSREGNLQELDSPVVVQAKLPGGVQPQRVLLASPDLSPWRHFQPIPFTTREDGVLRVTLPARMVHGSLLLDYRE